MLTRLNLKNVNYGEIVERLDKNEQLCFKNCLNKFCFVNAYKYHISLINTFLICLT